ncbi:hypothetical protein EYF80_044015 [Liparis tanakae]|uniref:Uncharacterized protein n=1 Tax=Liparis tanakae TaxID=230148 RepID=A0A4Z2FZI2_9TELE|nr:hypothetical protein EYF80_044015 [Liparis tanakae]
MSKGRPLLHIRPTTKEPWRVLRKAADVIAAFEADGLQAFVQTDLDTNQARIARSDHCHTPNHRQALRKQDCGTVLVGCNGSPQNPLKQRVVREEEPEETRANPDLFCYVIHMVSVNGVSI